MCVPDVLVVGGAATEAVGDSDEDSAEEGQGDAVRDLALASGVIGVSVQVGTAVVDCVAIRVSLQRGSIRTPVSTL